MKTLDVTFSGLWNSANPYSKAPSGAMQVADNVVLRDPSYLDPRRGYTATSANPSGANTRVFPWNGRMLVQAHNGDIRDFSDATGWSSAYGTYAAPDAANATRTAIASKSIFWTTSKGVKQLDQLGGTVQTAGVASPPYLTATTSTTGTTWLAMNSSAAYVAVLCRYDANNNLVQSAPTPSRLVVSNAGATCNVTVTGALPSNYNGATFVQLYRTFSVGSGVTPSAEYFQVAEHTLTAADFASGLYTFQQDITADSALGGPLYTNANTAQGSGVTNDLPPLARDLCTYNNRLLYTNTTESYALQVRMIGVGSFYNPPLYGGNLYVAGTVFSASNTESVNAKYFQAYSSGSPASDIENTCRSICRVVSLWNILYGIPGQPRIVAYYTSGPNDPPGRILFQEVGAGGTFPQDPRWSATNGAFAFDPTGGAVWVSEVAGLPATANGTGAPLFVAAANKHPARLWWSNEGEPWGVNLDSYVDVGAADKAILRAVLIRNTVFLFKTDGLWTLQGDTPDNYDLRPFDPTLVLLAPDSCAVVGNQIFCWTNRGVVYVSESGVSTAVSKPIIDDFLYVQGNFAQYTTAAFGVPYENDGLYLIAAPIAANDTGCSQQYVFHSANPTDGLVWTRWLIANASHGCYNPVTQGLVWCVGSTLWEERKTYTSLDFQDPSGVAITSVIQPLPLSAGDPIYQKQWQTLFLSFKSAEFSTCTVGFVTDTSSAAAPATKNGPATGVWGGFPWGTSPWSAASKNFILRVDVPQANVAGCTISPILTVGQASAGWRLQGLSMLYEPSTQLVRR